MSGIYNGVAPQPQTNSQMMHTLAKEKGGFFVFPKVPAAVLKIVMGEMSTEVLKSSTVSSAKTEASGFRFQYPTLQQAAADLLG